MQNIQTHIVNANTLIVQMNIIFTKSNLYSAPNQ